MNTGQKYIGQKNISQTRDSGLPQAMAVFEGRWQVQRRIADMRAGQQHSGAGQALILPDGAGRLRYQEDLRLSLAGGQSLQATRGYRWQETAEGFNVFFEEGGYFHHVTLGAERAQDHHNCPPDSYSAEYDFSDWPHWRVSWEVHGPRKAYRMESRFAPEGDPA